MHSAKIKHSLTFWVLKSQNPHKQRANDHCWPNDHYHAECLSLRFLTI